MSIFNTILNKLGLGKKDEAPKASTPASSTPAATPAERTPIRTGIGSKKEAMDMVDVVAKIDGMAKDFPAELNWKESIVDLLKLLDIDSSFENRKELAVELGVPTEFLEDSAKMNVWLHKAVMKKISENGGNVPASLLD